MKPFSRTATVASAIATVLMTLGVSPWYSFMTAGVLFTGAVRLTGIFPGNFPSITTMAATGLTVKLIEWGLRPLYSFLLGGILAYPLTMLLIYKYVLKEERFETE